MTALQDASGRDRTTGIWRSIDLRRRKDLWFTAIVRVGGVSALFAILLIFFYLAFVAWPMLKGVSIEPLAQYDVPGGEHPTVDLSLEEIGNVALRIDADGTAILFSAHSGDTLAGSDIGIPPDTTITGVTYAYPGSELLALGLSSGEVLIARREFEISYPNDIRTVSVSWQYPFGSAPFSLTEDPAAVSSLGFSADEESATLAVSDRSAGVALLHLLREESLLGDEAEISAQKVTLDPGPIDPGHLLIDATQSLLYIAGEDGDISLYRLNGGEAPQLLTTDSILHNDARLTTLEFLTGTVSLLSGHSDGSLSQWFTVRDDDNNVTLQHIRDFDAMPAAIHDLRPETRRKGFIALDESGNLGIYHTTAHRTLSIAPFAASVTELSTLSPRADFLMTVDRQGQFKYAHLSNKHPEVSLQALWEQVWYEHYPEPDYIWQSSSANNDFEPKFSLVPLTFGTLKAAFYAMVLAAPLAIAGAVYTAFFMAPGLRRKVKPAIETMEALPTVILGFLAGLWLAPLVEHNLPGVFSLLVIIPFGVLAFGYAWHHAPAAWRHRIPPSWHAALLVPVILLLGWMSLALSQPLEALLFNGDMRLWLTNDLGIPFDQRNAIVVGAAMGFAVIPTIFSISEDAVFSVPRHLVYGSLALGATPWQTLVRVVLLTASPGIFSALMIGMGRAVGETMIVLMATGNTAVMDFSIFQGMRTLAANIAVEMPESAVGSTHYRILFLTALVLFLFTFVINTMAEIVRQRLRRKYSTL